MFVGEDVEVAERLLAHLRAGTTDNAESDLRIPVWHYLDPERAEAERAVFRQRPLVAAVSAVDEHSKSTLDGLVKDNGKTVFEAEKDPHTQDDQEIVPNTDIDPITH